MAAAESDLAELYALLREFEGCRLAAYLCPAKVWTCGWGSTGPGIGPGTVWSQEVADERLAQDAQRFARGALALCPGLRDGGFVAVSDFAYNTGLSALRASTFRRKVNARDLEGAVAQLLRWVRGGGRILPGLVRRRAREAALLRRGGF